MHIHVPSSFSRWKLIEQVFVTMMSTFSMLNLYNKLGFTDSLRKKSSKYYTSSYAQVYMMHKSLPDHNSFGVLGKNELVIHDAKRFV